METEVPSGSQDGCYKHNLIGLFGSFGPFNCNYAQFSLQPQTVNLLLAVQEFMNRCIYFVLQKLLHFTIFV